LTEARSSIGLMSDDEFYAGQSRVTEPGKFAARVNEVPGSLSAMRTAARNLVFHYRADGDFAENGIAAERIAEIDTRYAEDMLARLVELADQPLAADRKPCERLVGCCRDFTVLFLAILRAHGVPARARVGFAAYFPPGWFVDHVVAEVWDADQRRWRLVDAELADDYADPATGALLDVEDLSSSQFITGAAAWLACRDGSADADRFCVSPDLDIPVTRGWPYIRHNLILDLAALTGREMVLWDNWGWSELAELSASQLAVLDDLARAISRDAPLSELRTFYERDGLRVPAEVTSYSPASEVPLQVAV
jgi:Transglutaminase-like superfamily